MAATRAVGRDLPVLTPTQILAEVRRLGIATPTEAAAIIRADRDTQHGR